MRALSSLVNKPSHYRFWLHFCNFLLELNRYFQSSHSPWPQESFSDHSLFLQLYLEQPTCFLAIAQQHSTKSSSLASTGIMPPMAIRCTQVPSSVFSVVLFQFSLSFFPWPWAGVTEKHHLLESSLYLEIINLLKRMCQKLGKWRRAYFPHVLNA